jgi:hypothetical protein
MSLPYPRNAFGIVQAKANGMHPAGPLVVVLNGSTPEWDNAMVYADPGMAYRWDWIRGLGVVVLIGAETRLHSILSDIETGQPGQIDVIDTERKLGWLVLFTKPKLRTVKWPQHQVMDWLGDCSWHHDLEQIKAKSKQQTAAKEPQPTFDLEPVWN